LTSYLARILFLQGYGSLFWESPSSTRIFNGLQYIFQVWQGFKNVSKSFSYKDSLFILVTTRKESQQFTLLSKEAGQILFLKRRGLFNVFPNIGRKVIKIGNKGGNLFSYLSKLNKEIQANQGHQRKGGSNTNFSNQIFPSLCRTS
jgi:hypothetical protein